MDLNEKDKFGLEKSNDDHLSYHTSALSSDWRFGNDLINPSLGLVSAENPMSVCKGVSMDSAPCSSVSMVDSFCPGIWDHRHGSQNLTLGENNLQTSTTFSDVLGIRTGVSGSSRLNMEKAFDMGWNNPNSMSKGDVFVQSGAGILPQSVSQFPADSAFIKRAARFSCFNGGSYTDMVKPFSISGSTSSYSKNGGIQVPERLSGNETELVSRAQSQKNELDIEETAKDDFVSVNPEVTEGNSMMKMEREMGNLLRPPHEGKQRNRAVSNDSDEAEFSVGSQEEPSNLENASVEPASKVLNVKKRRRNIQDVELEQVKGASQSPIKPTKENVETKQKIEQNPTSNSIKNAGKNAKENSQNSDAPKEDYIHVRARRGQATNSHSLAERVTGKAVMLDEIINYVQSLQRQVEFLSMKLAAVNPRLDLSIEGLLSKDILQSCGGTSSTVGFSPDMSMAHPQLHPTQQGLGQAGLPAMGNPLETLRRTINSQLTAINGYRDPTSQISNVWDDELHTVIQMSFGTNIPFNNQELNSLLPPGHMKVEL